jgi:hypothetical protein
MSTNKEEGMNLIYTAGELFPDGDAMEQLSGGRLLLWQQQEGRATVEPTLSYVDQRYAPASLDLSWQQAIRFPTHVEPAVALKHLPTQFAVALRIEPEARAFRTDHQACPLTSDRKISRCGGGRNR